MARVYADKDFPGPSTRRLIELGHVVLTARTAGNADRQVPDEEVLSFAHSQERALLTLNRRDFIRIHKSGAQHSGIIACTDDKDHLAMAARVDEALRTEKTLTGQLIRITRPR